MLNKSVTLFLVAAAGLGLNNLVSAYYNEQPCISLPGRCMPTASCGARSGSYVSYKCPSQANDIRCCKYPYQESACRALSGTCKFTSSGCSGGSFVSNKCPEQPSGVKCCVGGGGTGGGVVGPCPEIVSRSSWGARSPKRPLSNMADSSVTHIFVHHTTGGRCFSRSTCDAKVRGFQSYHQNTNNWNDIGYSFLIGGDGSIYEGRGWNKIGAHTPNFNARAYGVAFIGDFTSVNPSSAAQAAFHSLVKCMTSTGKAPTWYQLKGHRQAKATSCPGNKLYATLKGWPNWTA